jgi:putative hydrolase of the HAD superfamily
MALELVIFDLDDTLYPRSRGVMAEIGRRIHVWLCENLGLEWDEAVRLRRSYYRRYGTTLGGLIARHEIDAHDYLVFVHDVPLEEYLEPNPALADMLCAIPLRKAIYTNATSVYCERVLRALGVGEHFGEIVGIEEVGLRNKPRLDAYEQALALLGARGAECVMVEDTARNLWPARELGMTTVLVGEEGEPWVDFTVGSVLEVGGVVQELLAGAGIGTQIGADGR